MDQQNVEDRFICVWLDNQLMRSEDYIDTQDQIRTIIKAFLNFKDSNQCVDFITDTTDAKIFFITTNVLGKILVPIIHFFEQVHSIYIFYTKKSSDEDWTKDYKKIKGIYNDITQICDRFKQDTIITEDETESFAISFISPSDISSSDVKRQDPSFMYFQLLKDIILNDCLSESEEQTKADMIDYCRKVNIDNPNALDLLDQFEKDFIPELSIYWYTRECFLYKMLNKALWTPQPDVLYKLRYFIRHLHYQILSEASKQREHLSSMTVYRGQSMSSDQIEKLKRNVGGFLSFNNFLSTSLKRDVALNFLLGSEIGVLFEMQIDPTIQKFPIVNIEQISFLQKDDCEQELLFAMGSVFRILRIDKQRDFYRVQLTLSDDIDEQLAAYTKVTRDKTRTFHSFLSLLRLMDELGQYSCVDQFAEMLRDDIGLATNSSLLAAVHHMFGSIYHSRGQNKEALNHYHQTLNIYLSDDLPADHPTLTPTYNNIGCVYLAQSDYAKALEYQQLALDCQLNSDDPQNQSIITYITNIGKTYGNQEKYSEAIVHYKRALDLQKQHFGENDSSLAETYRLISSAYRNQGDFEQAASYREKAVALQNTTSELNPETSADNSITSGTYCLSQEQYEEALVHFKRALEIQQQYLLSNHPSLGTTYNHIGETYYGQDQLEEALSYYKKALEIEQSSFSDDHPSIAASYFNISRTYVGLSSWFEALEYGLKAVEQMKKTLQADVNTLASFVHHVGHIYHLQSAYQEALIYYEEALQLYHTHLPEDDASLAVIYHRTASTYFQMARYDDALRLFQKTLEIELKTLPDDAKTIADTYWSLFTAYLAVNQFDEAFISAELTIDQLRKTLPYNHPDIVQYRIAIGAIKQQKIFGNIYQ